MMQTFRLANIMFASTLFPQTENAPVLDIQKTLNSKNFKHLLQGGFCINRKRFTTLPSTVRLTSVRGGNEGGGKHDVCINIISTD